jgi:hypothetical protein
MTLQFENLPDLLNKVELIKNFHRSSREEFIKLLTSECVSFRAIEFATVVEDKNLTPEFKEKINKQQEIHLAKLQDLLEKINGNKG